MRYAGKFVNLAVSSAAWVDKHFAWLPIRFRFPANAATVGGRVLAPVGGVQRPLRCGSQEEVQGEATAARAGDKLPAMCPLPPQL